MNQLSFLTCQEKTDELPKMTASIWQLFVDGASRNNPGPAGAGVYLRTTEKEIEKKGYYLGHKSNNQAEYIALLIGLYLFKEHNPKKYTCITIYSDSQLLIRQLTGQYKVKNSVLHKYHQVALQMLSAYKYDLQHVLREKNTIADALANDGINNSISLPESFIAMMRRYEINL